tara:strand:- start:1788 stop:3008 length:1221 start_codon:yes stop_codon:yes gene_type:complete
LTQNKHICYISYDGITDPLGQSQVLPYITGINKILKVKFTIISFEKKSNKYKVSNQKKELNQENINWVPLTYTKYPPILSTLLDIFKLNLALKKVNFKKEINLIHCRSYITSLSGLKFKSRYKIPFIFDMRGFYADERIDGKIWNKNHFIYKNVYKYFKIKEHQFLQLSNHNISLTKAGKEEIESWNLQNLSPISTIPCCADENLFKKENIKEIRNELGIVDSDFIISYVGSIGTWYMLDEMLDFFKILSQKKSTSKFLFITKDNPDLIFQNCLKKNIPKSSILVKESSREMMPSYIGLSDFSIFFILPLYSKIASSPTKMGEIMNLGISIICNSGVGDVEKVINECMPELLVNEFNDQEYERIVDLILTNYKVNKSTIVKTSKKYFSLTKGVKKYANIYNQILKL